MSWPLPRSSARGTWLLLAALALPVAPSAQQPAAAAPRAIPAEPAARLTARLLVRGGPVLTVDPAHPDASAFAVLHGRLVAVGSAEQLQGLAGADTVVVELEGRAVVPGFIDAHCHPRESYPEESIHATLELGADHVKSVDELIAVLQRKAALTPQGGWILGRGYEDTALGRHPTRDDLDRASTEHLIKITHSSGHVSAVNSRCLEQAGYGESADDPAGGAFGRDATGRPDGVLRESASALVTRKLPPVPKPDTAQRVAALARGLHRDYLAQGITSIGPAGIAPSTLRRYQDVLAQGLRIRVNAMLSNSYLDEVLDLGVRNGLGNEWLRLGGIKVFHGNSLSGRTCWLSEPYAHDPTYYGIPPSRTQEELDQLIGTIHSGGLQACVHCNGDREIGMVLDAIERAQAADPRPDPRHRIEHGSVASPAIVDRMKALGVVYCPHSYVYEHGDKMEDYGAARWDWMHVNRSAIDAGVLVAGNSDSPVSAARPMLRLQSLCSRRSRYGKVYGASQRLSFEQALWTWTLGAAHASFEERSKGSLQVGKWADFVILDRDPRTVDVEELGSVQVLETWVGGERVYARDSDG